MEQPRLMQQLQLQGIDIESYAFEDEGERELPLQPLAVWT